MDLRIGRRVNQGDADPVTFVDRFSQEFTAADFSDVREQIAKAKRNNAFGEGSIVRLLYKDAIEITAHYSWAKRFDDEVHERYAYLPIGQYQEYIQKNFQDAGVNTKVIQHMPYLPVRISASY